jgi:geranylgeranylglycerol-phosphate geranylgeranyltransferase
MMKKIKALFELMRLEHGVMIAIAILVGSVISAKTFPALDKFIFTFCTALFLEASTFALNDYYDLEIDKKNKRTDRPLVRGDLSANTALYLFLILFPFGIICSYFVNITCFIIAIVTALFALLYDMILKKIKLLGNFFIAYTMAIPFVFGSAAVHNAHIFSLNISPAIIFIALIAFLAGSGREIMKDVMDFIGDNEKGVISFPRYIGIRGSNVLSAVFYITAITFSFYPFFSRNFEPYYLNYYYFIFVFITDTMLLSTSLNLIFKKQVNIRFHRTFTLFALFFGIIAFLIGAFIG